MTVVLIALAAVAILAGLFTLITYNRLVRMRLAVDNSWAQVRGPRERRHAANRGSAGGSPRRSRRNRPRRVEAASAAEAAEPGSDG